MSVEESADLFEPLTPREQEVLKLLAQGMPNREMADTLVLSIHTIKWHNRQIFGKLGVANREEAVARARALGLLQSQAKAGQRSLRLQVTTSPFVGREEELAELEGLLLSDGPRIVAIAGAGGMGKTHLAIEVARRLQDRFADGVAFVNLAPLQSIGAIVPSLAQALGFLPASGAHETTEPKVQLLSFLRDKRFLIVLDNFEHLHEATRLLDEIVGAASGIRLLVTTRERLKLHMAHHYWLQGLPVSAWTSVEQARRCVTVDLFLRHAKKFQPDLELHESDLPALQRILNLVQGMPLGIILAATWVEVLSFAQIANEIAHGLDFLEADYFDLPKRQRSMRAVFDSTWIRLSDRDRKLFAALSVFRGGFTLAAAQTVAGAGPRDLRRLIGHSLVLKSGAGRFEVHELLRQFAARRLSDDAGQEDEVLDKHSVYYIAFLGERASVLTSVHSYDKFVEIERDFQNCYAAWARIFERQKVPIPGPAAFTLALFCVRTTHLEEGLVALKGAIEALRTLVRESHPVDASALVSLVTLLALQCWLTFESGAFEEAEDLGQEALSLLARFELENEDTRWERGLTLLRLADVYCWQDRVADAEPMLHECASLFEAKGDNWHRALTFRFLGHAANRQAKFAQAVQYVRRSVPLFTAHGDRRERAMAQAALGFSLACAGKQDEGERKLRDSVLSFEEMGDQASAALAMLLLAEVIAYRGRFDEARAIARESTEVQIRLGRRNYAAMSHIRWCLALLHLGEYDAVAAKALGILQIAETNRAFMTMGRALFLSGSARLALDVGEAAYQELVKAVGMLREITSWDYLCEALAVLGCAHILTDEYLQAREALLEASELVFRVGIAQLAAPVVAAYAHLLLMTNGEDRAVELFAAASREVYIARSRWWQDVVGRRIKEVVKTLPENSVSDAQLRGDGGNLWQVMTEVLSELRGT